MTPICILQSCQLGGIDIPLGKCYASSVRSQWNKRNLRYPKIAKQPPCLMDCDLPALADRFVALFDNRLRIDTKMIMNVSHTTTQRAESQPEADSQPPDSAHRTRATTLSGGGQLQIRALRLSTNKATKFAFIAPAAEMFCPMRGSVSRGEPTDWGVQKALLPGSG